MPRAPGCWRGSPFRPGAMAASSGSWPPAPACGGCWRSWGSTPHWPEYGPSPDPLIVLAGGQRTQDSLTTGGDDHEIWSGWRRMASLTVALTREISLTRTVVFLLQPTSGKDRWDATRRRGVHDHRHGDCRSILVRACGLRGSAAPDDTDPRLFARARDVAVTSTRYRHADLRKNRGPDGVDRSGAWGGPARSRRASRPDAGAVAGAADAHYPDAEDGRSRWRCGRRPRVCGSPSRGNGPNRVCDLRPRAVNRHANPG